MKTIDFLKEHNACIDGANWALSIGEEMDAVWESLIKEEKYDWLIWTLSRPGVFPESVLRKTACKFIRQTPLSDGRTIWDMLTDERSRKAVEVAEAYADGKATKEELLAARASAHAAYVAAYAADDAAHDAADAARAYVYDAAYAADAAYTAAHAVDAAKAAYAAARAAYAAAHAAKAAYAAARAAGYAANAAADAAHDAADAARAYAYDAADTAYAAADTAYAQAKAAQIRMIAEVGNPFRKGEEK